MAAKKHNQYYVYIKRAKFRDQDVILSGEMRSFSSTMS